MRCQRRLGEGCWPDAFPSRANLWFETFQGVYRLLPEVRTLIEIGGPDGKFITLENGGRVRDFAMKDRCASIVAGRQSQTRLLLRPEPASPLSEPVEARRARRRTARAVAG